MIIEFCFQDEKRKKKEDKNLKQEVKPSRKAVTRASSSKKVF